MESEKRDNLRGKARHLFFVVLLVLLLRIIYVDLYQRLQISYQLFLSDFLRLFFTDLLTLSVAVACNMVFVWLLRSKSKFATQSVWRNSLYIIYILLISLGTALLMSRPHCRGTEATYHEYLVIAYLASLLVNAMFVICCDLFFFFHKSRQAIKQEGEKKRKAQYQYQQLKQQLNPHFLFNSLNVLDYLVQNEEKQRASDFIRKMAGIYRYLLETGEKKVVPVSEELHFVEMYVDLQRERFPEGLFMHVDVPDVYRQCYIIPCGLQILVENAIKHNIVSADMPLHIHIYIEDGTIAVRNNLQLRSGSESTGLGLANIKKQYNDIANTGIHIHKHAGYFTVQLPLL